MRAPLGNTVQLLTDRGPAAIAVIRLIGSLVPSFLEQHVRPGARRAVVSPADVDLASFVSPVPWRAGIVRPARLIDERGEPLDDIIVSIHADAPCPECRLHTHGGRGIVDAALRLAAAAGFRAVEESRTPSLWHAAEPLARVAFEMLPRMKTLAGAAWLLRQSSAFPAKLRSLLARFNAGEHDGVSAEIDELAARYRLFDWFSVPAPIALIGPPNAGKSTLLNALTDRPASIVSDIPGTTRDWVEAPGELGGYPVTWIDTAGLRHAPGDDVELEGVRRSLAVAAYADVAIAVFDGTDPHVERLRPFLDFAASITPKLIVLNKSDLAEPVPAIIALINTRWDAPIIRISASTRAGLHDFEARLLSVMGREGVDLAAPAPFVASIADAIEHVNSLSNNEL